MRSALGYPESPRLELVCKGASIGLGLITVPFSEDQGFGACISSRITTVIQLLEATI